MKDASNQVLDSFNKALTYVQGYLSEDYKPSDYWSEQVESLQYIYSANTDILIRLRDHTHWLTGVRSYDYKKHHKHMANKFENKLNKLRKVGPNLEMFGEMGVLGNFGHPINGALYNIDTLKFVESCIALEKFGILNSLRAKASPLICEIGAGWGGFISHLIRHLPRARFIIVDLPATLLFSATYLPVAFPEKTVGFLGSSDFTGEEDIIFSLPAKFLKSDINNLELVVNMVSFQEMTSEQVSQYSEKIRNTNCQYIYSLNRKVSRHNPQLKSVNESLIDWQIVSEVKLSVSEVGYYG